MKKFDRVAAQGDIMIVKVDSLPKGAVEVEPINGQNIVAHSETGHHHVIDREHEGAVTTMYRLPEEIYELFLIVENGPTLLKHERSFDTHEPIQLDPGTYKVRRQREYTPEGYRRVAD